MNIHCIENFFAVHHFGATCAWPKNNRVALKIFTAVNILFIFRIFEQLALALKTGLPWNFSLHWIYFLLFRIFEQLALALKKRVALEFFTVLNMYFLSFRIFEQPALVLKTEFALKFFKPGGAAAPPDPPPRTPMVAACLKTLILPRRACLECSEIQWETIYHKLYISNSRWFQCEIEKLTTALYRTLLFTKLLHQMEHFGHSNIKTIKSGKKSANKEFCGIT